MPAPYLKKAGQKAPENEYICLFAQTNFRNQMRRFGIKTDDRRRHMYIIGKTGMGKSTMMENMMLHDIYAGNGVGLVDPHGDFAEKIIDFIPSHRINDVIYFNPADLANPIGFNILEVKNEEQKHLVAAGLLGTFKKIWPDVWSSRMEYILNNTLLALLENPGTTLLGINRLMSDKKYRKRIVSNVTDPVVKAFWNVEFASYSERYAQEATSSVQNKIGQFLSTTLIRNIVAQTKSTIDIRKAMDEKKILIMNLSKGRMGEDNSRLMGGMLITKIQLSAMERVDTPEHDRKDFFLYVDEFQNFATPSFANILSEARKYRLGLIMAHQYVAQLDETVADAVFGNVGSIVSFRVGAADAEALAKEFAPIFLEEDIVNLTKFTILLKLMIDGVASQPFSALTMPPIGSPTASTEKIISVSRERYGRRRDVIEDKIIRWSGLGEGNESAGDVEAEHLPTPKEEKSTNKNISSEKKPFEKKTDSKNTPQPPTAKESISLNDLLPKPSNKNEAIVKDSEPIQTVVQPKITINKSADLSLPPEPSLPPELALPAELLQPPETKQNLHKQIVTGGDSQKINQPEENSNLSKGNNANNLPKEKKENDNSENKPKRKRRRRRKKK